MESYFSENKSIFETTDYKLIQLGRSVRCDDPESDLDL